MSGNWKPCVFYMPFPLPSKSEKIMNKLQEAALSTKILSQGLLIHQVNKTECKQVFQKAFLMRHT